MEDFDAVNAIFLLFEEGVPEDHIVERVHALDDEDRARLEVHLSVYVQNVTYDEAIPEEIVDDDGRYARLRERGRWLAPRLEHLLGRLSRGEGPEGAEGNRA